MRTLSYLRWPARESKSGHAARGRRSPEADRDLFLMGAIRGRDARALEELYARHAGSVLALVLRVLGDRGAAEETLIDVFEELWERSERFDPQRASPRTYILVLARSRAIDRQRALRGRRNELAVVVGDASDVERVAGVRAGHATAQEDTLASERSQSLARALAEISKEQRHAVELSFMEGLSHSEIAARLGAPLGTVKTRIRQGLLRLRRLLEDAEGEGR